jgi:hypothetical protein
MLDAVRRENLVTMLMYIHTYDTSVVVGVRDQYMVGVGFFSPHVRKTVVSLSHAFLQVDFWHFGSI